MKLLDDIKLPTSKSAPILQVDDDSIHLKIVKHFHNKSGISNPYLSFLSGDELIIYLKKICEDNGETPLLILIDINMPGRDGFEVLKSIRELNCFRPEALCGMLSSSEFDEDIEKSKRLGADFYLTKPDDGGDYLNFFIDLASRIN